MYIKYIENEYDINILKCTMKKGEIKKRGCIKNYHEFNEYFIKTSYITEVWIQCNKKLNLKFDKKKFKDIAKICRNSL